MGGDQEFEGLDSPESGPDASLPTWSVRDVEAGQADEIIDASLWLEAVGDAEAATTLARANAAIARNAVNVDSGAARASQAVARTPPSTVAGERGRRRRRIAMMLLGAAAALAIAGFAGWAVGRGSSSSVETAGVVEENGSTEEAAETAAGGDARVVDDQSSPETLASSSGEGVTTLTSTQGTVGVQASDSEPFVVPETPDNPSGATQYAVMAGGKAVMRGWYPTEEQARTAVADAAVIMGGMENVTDETQVDPRAEIRPDSFAVYLQDFILFEFDSAEITPEFYDFLGFPLFFMQNNPAATVTVVARTDARGSASYNLGLATRRAEAVRDHWLANGGNADQIILDPRGEEDADTSGDDDQAALDRRVELRVSGFLAG